MNVHPAAELFPMMSEPELEELAANIAKNGLREGLTVDLDGVLLDGRNRLEACGRAGVKPHTIIYKDDDPVEFIISKNIHRRHLTTSQRAVLALEILPHYEAQAAQRVRDGGRRGGLSAGSLSSNEDRLRAAPCRPAVRDAAKAVGVGQSSVERAKRIATEAPELLDPIRSGSLTVTAAAKKLSPPKRSKPGPSLGIDKQRRKWETAWGSLTGTLEGCAHIQPPDDFTPDEAAKCANELGRLIRNVRDLQRQLKETSKTS